MSFVETTAWRLLAPQMYCFTRCLLYLFLSFVGYTFRVLFAVVVSLFTPTRRCLLAFTSSHPLLTACPFPSFHIFSSPGVFSYTLKYTVISSLVFPVSTRPATAYFSPPPFPRPFPRTFPRGPAAAGVSDEFPLPIVQLG